MHRTASILALALSSPALAAAAPLSASTDRAWIAASDANTRLLLEAEGQFDPETISQNGVVAFDGRASDLGPKLEARRAAALAPVRAEFARRLAATDDANVRQDLAILIGAIDQQLERDRLNRRHFLAWTDAPAAIFEGIKGLLDEQVAPARRAEAVELLRRYVGDWPGTTPLVDQARARFEETRAPGLLGPTRVTLDRALANAETYAKGIRDMFKEYKITGAERALAKLDAQIAAYTAWERATVRPLAREDFHLPAEVYAFQLKERGIDIAPDALIRQAQIEYAETRAAMIALAPRVAKEKGWSQTDYRDVIRRIKQAPVPDDQLEASYAEVIRTNESVIRREHIVDLPSRPMEMRLASAAESAASPAPHMQPPPMVGNKGEHGVFVLPVGVGGNDPKSAYDDFNSRAVQWTVAAHEGRPGHELQFSAMVERGVSQARSLYAFNSVNVEGWALYAEAEALPYHPLDGQLMALQARLLRAARAMLDPMLNLNRISLDEARRILTEEVVQSPAMARQEIERYTARAPGQAGSYFYGYTRLLQLRVETEFALGSRFDRLAFNNFVIGLGLLPPDLVAKAVREDFVPAMRGDAPAASNQIK
ncbi:DUF885 domain-containing protein [Sphingomonas trueperi]|uniref:DUF885 domain-containing protein n=1 Tax=Sphingomonas trueperi TaxID=53317 RepID=UPI000EAEF59B